MIHGVIARRSQHLLRSTATYLIVRLFTASEWKLLNAAYEKTSGTATRNIFTSLLNSGK
jgi:hypothetical protein